VVLEVSDSARAGSGTVQADVRSSSDTNGFRITLAETPLRGLFRSRIVLVTNVTAPARLNLQAVNRDQISASYADATNRVVIATATVDTDPPVVSGVAADPAYNEATITWSTDKPADALVRFGEKPGGDSFFNRSAYSAESATEHAVVLKGLLPDRDYYLEVISRDQAGNSVKDSNGGKMYTFHTLVPIPAPWSTDLENGSQGWVTFNDTGSGSVEGDPGDEGGGDFSNVSAWEYGTPANDYSVTAHSGTNCWATNLKGLPVDTAISDLISPAIDLTHGNRAALHFWQWYDFTSRSELLDIEAGQVLISVDDGANWSDLYATQFETSDDWEEIEVDISKYTGNVIRIRWNYQMLSFDTVNRPGWFIDDVSIDLTNRVPSNFIITNNLAQASFTVTGPANFGTVTGGGLSFNVTNAVAGAYIISWNPVPYYDSPSTVTNELGTNGLKVSGVYTFVDTNHNGAADPWEVHYFGNLAGTDLSQRDTDGDGASDLQEFFAGTDPTDPTSSLKLGIPAVQPSGLVKFTWPTVNGHLYTLQTSGDLHTWQAASATLRGTGTDLTVTLPPLGLAQSTAVYFFRVAVQP
jgi:hypothetical protein